MNTPLFLKKEGAKGLLIRVLLYLVVGRTVVDLVGGAYSEEGQINPGGIVGLLFSAGAILLLLLRVLEKGRVYYFTVFISIILIVYAIGLASIGTFEIASVGRFILGFSAVLLLIYPQKYQVNIGKIINIYFFILLIPISIAWLQFLNFYDYSYFDYINGELFGRPSGGYFQPNSLTRILIFGILLTYISDYKKRMNFQLKYGMICLFLLTIFISGHRTSMLIALLIIFLVDVVGKIKSFTIFLPLTSILAIAAGVGVYRSMGETLKDYASIYSSYLNLYSNGQFNLRGREMIWQEIFDDMQMNYGFIQWIFGRGAPFFEAHNDLLRILMVNGLFGVIVFFCFMVYIYRFCIERSNRFGRNAIRVTFLYLFLFGLTLQPMEYSHFMQLFFFSLFAVIQMHGRDSVVEGPVEMVKNPMSKINKPADKSLNGSRDATSFYP